MSAVAIDTHAVVKRLIAAGFTDEQAEAVTLIVREAQNVDFSDLATKTDIAIVKGDIAVVKADIAVVKADIGTVKAGLERSLAENKAEILKWLVGSIGFQTVIIIGAVFALARGMK